MNAVVMTTSVDVCSPRSNAQSTALPVYRPMRLKYLQTILEQQVICFLLYPVHISPPRAIHITAREGRENWIGTISEEVML